MEPVNVRPEEAKARLLYWQRRAMRYTKAAEVNGGRMTLSDSWCRDYCESPYLALASEDYLAERFIDHFHNLTSLDEHGGIVPRTGFTDPILAPIFSDLQMEYNSRGGIPEEVAAKATAELRKYFKNGRPKGVKLFANHPASLDNVLVKFGKEKHLRDMLEKGEVRLSPAGFYKKGSLLKAMRDLETERAFHIPAFTDILRGRRTVAYRGTEGKIDDGFIKVIIECPNYVLWSACADVDRRLPEDFDADAALVNKQPELFAQRFLIGARTIWNDVSSWHGLVDYYDPCSLTHTKARPETFKHFLFAYQREWRLCLYTLANTIPDEPINLEIGSLSDIAELVVLRRE